MVGVERVRDYWKITSGIACSAILLAGLAGRSHWHHSAKTAGASQHKSTLASSARAAQPLFTVARAFASPPLAIAHQTRLTLTPGSAALALPPAADSSSALSPVVREQAVKVFNSLPIKFEANTGQTDPRVKFLSRGPGYTLFLTHDEAVLSLPTKSREHASNSQTAKAPVRSDVLTMRLVGADHAAEVSGIDAQKSVTNYFKGSDPQNWHTRVPNYARVKYENVYPGVNQVYYGNQHQLESDFIVAPGADPSAILLEIRGAQHMRLDAQGNLILKTRSGEMRLLKPVLYQPANETAKERTEVKGGFVLRGPRGVGFATGSYDHTRTLVIDPVMSFFSYFSGDGNDVIRAVAVDQQGNMYVTGQTTSDIQFPPYQVAEGCQNNLDCKAGEVFVFKISSIGTAGTSPQLAYFNFFFVQIVGRTTPPNGDIGTGLAVDSQGNAYVAGTTTSGDFGTVNPCQGCSGDGFVAELDPTGNIIFSTTLAGIGSQITGLALDSASPPHVFVGGTLAGDALTPNTPNGFTPVNAFQQTGPAQSTGLTTGFVAELGTGTTACAGLSVTQDCVLYATFFGGTKGSPGDFINGIAVDSQGLVYITGTTSTSDFPLNSKLPGYSQTTCLTTETCTLAFLAKLDPTAGANGLLYSTTLGLPTTGGPVQYIGTALALAKDGSGYAYLTGTTGNQLNGVSNNNGGLFFPTTPGAIGTSQSSCTPLSGGGDSCPGSFVSEINTNATGPSSLVASTYLGGVNGVLTSANAIAVDAAGNAFVAGGTNSLDFPLPNFGISTNAIQNVLPASAVGIAQPIQSVFLAVLPAGLNNILYSTYLGGSGQGACFPLNDCTVGNVTYQPTGSTVVNDFANAVALDSFGDAFIAGQETSGNFYVAPAAQTLYVNSFDSVSAGNKGWAEIIGTGITAPSTFPIVSLSPAGGINFGNLGLTGSITTRITVTNIGTAALNFYYTAIVPDSGTPTSTFTKFDTCSGRSIAISATCIINVTFTPGAIGSYGATLQLVDSATSGTQTVRLTGAGVAPFPEAALTLFQNGTSSTSFNDTIHFGTIEQGGSSSTVTIQLQNSGTAPLVIGSLSVVAFGGNARDIITSGDTCSGQTIPVSNFCMVNLTFAPTSVPGTQYALALVIPDNAPDTPQEVALIGTSGAPAPPTALPVLASADDSVPPVPASSAPGVPIGIVHSGVSSGGQFVAFESTATNLPGPPLGTSGISLRTICLPPITGCTPLTNYISYAPTSGPNANGGAPCFGSGYAGSTKPAIDSTGQFVAFLSDSCVPVQNATPETQIYLRNVGANSTSLISLDDSGNPLNAGMNAYSMSANARYFAYSSSSSNVAGLTNNFTGQIFLRDANCAPPAPGCTQLISKEPSGNPTPSTTITEQPSISPDGRYVVFSSTDTSLPNVAPQSFAANAVVVYLRDTCIGATGSCTPTTTAISADVNGMAVSGGEGAAVANGGRFIIFNSFACSLLPGGCTGTSPEETYFADTCTYNGTPVQGCAAAPPKLISFNQLGQPDTFLSATAGTPVISADGRLALFTSYTPLFTSVTAQAIYAYDTCSSNNVPVANCTAGLRVVSVDSAGTAFGNGSDLASIDLTGQFLSFGTSGDLVTAQNPTPMSGGVYLGLTSGFAGSTAPALQITPTALDFGNVLPTATSSTQTITVTNSSPLLPLTSLTISPATLTSGFAYANPVPSPNACQTGSQLLPLQSCTTQVSFTPLGIGPEAGSLSYGGSGVASQNVTLAGWGGQAAIVFEDMSGNPITSLDFGTIQTGTTATLQAQIANTGTAPAATAPLDFLLYSVTGPFSANVSQCPSNPSAVTNVEFPNLLAPGASCIVTLFFTQSTAGAGSGLLTFVDNAQTSNTPITPSQTPAVTAQSLPLSGTTAAAPQAHLVLTVVPSPNPAILNSPLTYQITLTNAGPATAQGITLNLVIPNAYPQGAYTTMTWTQFTCTPPTTGSPYATCSLNSLPLNASATITFNLIPEQVNPSFISTFYLNETSVDPNPIYDTVTVSVPVVATAPSPAIVTDNETITVSDTVAFLDNFDSEMITVKDNVMVTACTAFDISPSGTLTPSATVGTPYSLAFTPSEAGTFTWATGGTLPAGLNLNASTGLLSGVPNAAGAFSFTVIATDQNGCSGSANITLTVNPAPTGTTTTTITATSSSYQGLTLPANLALVGIPITVNFKVVPLLGNAAATGTVTVTAGTSAACQVTLTSTSSGSGSCALTISQLGSGSTPIVALYSPDSGSSGLLPSTSSPLTESVVQITTCGPLPSAQTSAQGTTVTFTFSTCIATDVLTAPGYVVTGCPPNAQCSATITQVNLLEYMVVVKIVLQGSGNSVPLKVSRPLGQPRPLTLFWFGVLMAILMAFQLARQNRVRPRLLYAVGFLMALLLSGMSGCTSASVVNGGGAVSSNSYTITVKVTAGSYSVNVPLTLTVKK
jgi:hypothetical protein